MDRNDPERASLESRLNRLIRPMTAASEEVKASAKADEMGSREAIGWNKVEFDSTYSIQSWMGDVERLVLAIEVCEELGDYSAELSIQKPIEGSNETAFYHTSCSSKELKKLLDSGRLVNSTIVLTVFKKLTESSFLQTYYNILRERRFLKSFR